MKNDETFKLRLPADELTKWRQRAEAADLSLAAWIRERCNVQILESVQTQSSAIQEKRASRKAVSGLRNAPDDAQRLRDRVHPPGEQLAPRHTAESNWRTCLCGTCVNKRKEHEL